MKIAINPCIGRPEEPVVRRKSRRLLYLAAIARSMGHDVSLHEEGRPLGRFRGRAGFDFLRLREEFPANSPSKADLYFCSSGTATGGVPTNCPTVAWKEGIGFTRDRELAEKVALIVAYIWRLEDFTREVGYGHKPRPRNPPGHVEHVGPKVLSVPWLAHDTVLAQLDGDGMTDAYLADDLESIRDRYGSPSKLRQVGFYGYRWPQRSQIAALFKGDDRFDFQWSSGESKSLVKLPPDRYLGWVSGCRAMIQLPGDTWKCSRHCESVMMGVPVVQLAGKIHLMPPLSAENTVLVDDWQDKDGIFTSLERAREIAAKADGAYREGWSLRGQFSQVLKRLSLSNT